MANMPKPPKRTRVPSGKAKIVARHGSHSTGLDDTGKKLRKRYARLEAKLLHMMHDFAVKDPKQFARMACEAVLHIDPIEKNPFVLSKGTSGDDWMNRSYCDLATSILAGLDKKSPQISEDGFVRISDWVEPRMHLEFLPAWQILQKGTGGTAASHALSVFFQSQEAGFGYAIGMACELVYHGVPVFLFQPSNGFSRVSYTDPDYVYLSKKGEYCDSGEHSSFPAWTRKYAFRCSHIDAHKIFFGGDLGDLSTERVGTLRDAFRRHIHEAHDAGEPKGTAYGTRLLSVVTQVAESQGANWLGRRTWPKKEAYISELQTRYSISENEAKAIDLVTRPDELRRKFPG